MACIVFIKGIPQLPDVAARNQPGVKNSTVLFRPKVGTQATAIEVKPDPDGDNFQGQIYKWFHLTFSDGTSGWVRDDLLDLQGDCIPIGYGNYASRTYAFTALTAATPTPSSPASAPVSSTPAATTVSTPPTASQPTVVNVTVPPAASVTVTPSTSSNLCTAMVRTDLRAKLRSGPSISAAQLAVLDGGTNLNLTEIVKGQDNDNYRWLHVNANGTDGYVREDLINYIGDCSSYGVATSGATAPVATPITPITSPTGSIGLWPSPLRAGSYSIFQEYLGTKFGSPHKGADLSESAGAQISAGGPGLVAWIMRCTRCTDAQPNFNSQGIQTWDVKAISDPAWGFGFGNHVVLRHAYHDVPDGMRHAMDQANLTGGYVYVIHGHMQRIDIATGTAVQVGTPLGLLGTTGNSTGPHLHLEVRADKSPNLAKTGDLYNRAVFNPRLIYSL